MTIHHFRRLFAIGICILFPFSSELYSAQKPKVITYNSKVHYEGAVKKKEPVGEGTLYVTSYQINEFNSQILRRHISSIKEQQSSGRAIYVPYGEEYVEDSCDELYGFFDGTTVSNGSITFSSGIVYSGDFEYTLSDSFVQYKLSNGVITGFQHNPNYPGELIIETPMIITRKLKNFHLTPSSIQKEIVVSVDPGDYITALPDRFFYPFDTDYLLPFFQGSTTLKSHETISFIFEKGKVVSDIHKKQTWEFDNDLTCYFDLNSKENPIIELRDQSSKLLEYRKHETKEEEFDEDELDLEDYVSGNKTVREEEVREEYFYVKTPVHIVEQWNKTPDSFINQYDYVTTVCKTYLDEDETSRLKTIFDLTDGWGPYESLHKYLYDGRLHSSYRYKIENNDGSSFYGYLDYSLIAYSRYGEFVDRKKPFSSNDSRIITGVYTNTDGSKMIILNGSKWTLDAIEAEYLRMKEELEAAERAREAERLLKEQQYSSDCQKYGKEYVDFWINNSKKIKVGMSEVMIMDFLSREDTSGKNPPYYYFKTELRAESDYTRYYKLKQCYSLFGSHPVCEFYVDVKTRKVSRVIY